ncbi:hypothetical protein PENSTE_c005G07373 [Penicillium steckii]|uniref:Uncharacterized protein n=1 Tax=Penicillium steckii TaxID=303698 RepID=A0A1V6TJK0_9EURO|nr:hypothetical protein PENSTE_c005G07373 [Penicillium steckii]
MPPPSATTQARNLPETIKRDLPNIPKLDKNGDFSAWASRVEEILKQRAVNSLITSLPRPETSDADYKKWQSWSVTIRSWLFAQMSNDMLDYVLVFYRKQGATGALPKYADQMFRLIKLASGTAPDVLSRAVRSFWQTRRVAFSSPHQYIAEWMKVVDRLRALDHPIDSSIAVEIMLTELEKEMPAAVAKVRAKIQWEVPGMEARSLSNICREIVEQSGPRENTPLLKGSSHGSHLEKS